MTYVKHSIACIHVHVIETYWKWITELKNCAQNASWLDTDDKLSICLAFVTRPQEF
jgi:hypothetical protein